MTGHTQGDTPTRFFDAGGIRHTYRGFGNGYALPHVAQPLRHADQRSEEFAFTPRSQVSAGQPTLAGQEYLAMVRQYRASGGLATGNEVVRLMREIVDQPVSVLARWIVRREVVCFIWKSEHLVPVFQFERRSMSLRPQVSTVLSELVPVFDECELALWFAQPNSWLQGAAPADLISPDAAAVLNAARADRFVATG